MHNRRVYWAMCVELDELIGRVLTALREGGGENRTHVIMVSDHGDNQGEHRLPTGSKEVRSAGCMHATLDPHPIFCSNPAQEAAPICCLPSSCRPAGSDRHSSWPRGTSQVLYESSSHAASL